mgnify:CR=1 FL=1
MASHRRFQKIRRWRDTLHALNKHGVSEVEFEGTVKLHGSNAGVIAAPGAPLQAQSRKLLIDETGLSGFGAFVAQNESLLAWLIDDLKKSNDVQASSTVVIFGEWCGGNIQKGVALTHLPKHYAIYEMYVLPSEHTGPLAEDTYERCTKIPARFPATPALDDAGIYCIDRVPPIRVTVQVDSPDSVHAALDLFERVTNEAGALCPWAKTFGVEGAGEGWVWSPTDIELRRFSDNTFKTKAEAFKNPAGSPGAGKKAKSVLPPGASQSLTEFAQRFITQARLAQAAGEVVDEGDVVSARHIGKLIQWVLADLLKEEPSEIAALQETLGTRALKLIGQRVGYKARLFAGG